MYVTMGSILNHAHENYYGVMAMNCINLEMARAAITAAEEERSPIIVQMGPGQMKKHAHPSEMVPLVIKMAEEAIVPVALNLDHGAEFAAILDGIQRGFSNVMFDGSELPFEENMQKTKLITTLAHQKGITVEAELGHVGQALDEDEEKKDFLTNPEQALLFVQETGIDALAVAIGTAHGAYPKNKIPILDFERLREIKETVNIPLVLHGGSACGEENLRRAVAGGINKINICTDAFAVCKATFLEEVEKNPNADYLAISMVVEKKLKEFAKEFMRIIGSSGQYAFAGSLVYSGHE